MKYITLNKMAKITISNKVETFFNPDYVYIPIKDEKLLIKQDDVVLKGMPLFQNNLLVTSPISGKVLGLKKKRVDGKDEKCLVIKNDFKEKRVNLKRKNYDHLTVEKLIDSLEKYDIKHLVNIFKSLKEVDNIVISIIEDEPYVENKIILFKENINEILSLIDNLRILYKSKKNNLIIKAKESSLIDDCLETIGTYPFINLTLVDDLYLLGYPKYLLEYLKIEESKTLYLTVDDVILIHNLVYDNLLASEKYLTISGDALEEGKVIKVKKYTSASDVILKYFSLTEDTEFIINGLMKGYKENITDVIISDKVESITIMKKRNQKVQKCFNCGKCVQICPVKINPKKCLVNGKKDKRCLNCGLCNYVCPSFIDLKKIVKGEK